MKGNNRNKCLNRFRVEIRRQSHKILFDKYLMEDSKTENRKCMAKFFPLILYVVENTYINLFRKLQIKHFIYNFYCENKDVILLIVNKNI